MIFLIKNTNLLERAFKATLPILRKQKIERIVTPQSLSFVRSEGKPELSS